MPVKISPRTTGIVRNSRTKKPLEGVSVYSRRYESNHYQKKSETVQDGTFSIAANWSVTPIPFFYFWPTRQLKFSLSGYNDYSVTVDENSPKSLKRSATDAEGLTIELEPDQT